MLALCAWFISGFRCGGGLSTKTIGGSGASTSYVIRYAWGGGGQKYPLAPPEMNPDVGLYS